MVKSALDDLIIGGSEPLPPDLAGGHDQADAALEKAVSMIAGDDVASSQQSLVLDLADLLPDDSGEVVLFTGDDVAVNLLSSEPVTEAGVAEEHVTASGLDVTGLHYCAFENGVKVYSESDLQILNSADIT